MSTTQPTPKLPPALSDCGGCPHYSPRLSVGMGAADYVSHRCAHPANHSSPALIAVLPLSARAVDFAVHGCPLRDSGNVADLLAEVARQSGALEQQQLGGFTPRPPDEDGAEAWR
jgi:hypothetical protein